MSDFILSLSEVSKSYRTSGLEKLTVLSSIDLSIAAGDLVGLTAPSGAWKSTLLHICGLLDTCDSGTINFLGNEITFEKTKFDKKKYFLGIRPEHFNLSNESQFKFKPKIDLVENLGNEKIVYMSNDNLELSAKISSQADFQNQINFDSKDIFIFDENGKRI